MTRGALESALGQPRNRREYRGEHDLDRLAAAYAFGRNHGYSDGIERIAFVAMAVFLDVSGPEPITDEGEVVSVMLSQAAGNLGEAGLADRVRGRISELPGGDAWASTLDLPQAGPAPTRVPGLFSVPGEAESPKMMVLARTSIAAPPESLRRILDRRPSERLPLTGQLPSTLPRTAPISSQACQCLLSGLAPSSSTKGLHSGGLSAATAIHT